jgi:long-chain acyl-CoA synthetase
LQRHEAVPGEVVALLADNGFEFIAGLFGILAAGATAALIDPALPPRAIRAMIRGARARILCWSGRRPVRRLLQCPELSSTCRTVVLTRTDEVSEQGISHSILRSTLSDTLPAVIAYSSGTTGEPKGIVLSHRAIAANVRAIGEYLEPSRDDTFLIVKSMVHSSTIVGEVLVALAAGAKIIALDPLVPPSQMFRRIRDHRPTIVGLNPSILRFFLNEGVSAHVLESLRTIHVSGSIVDREVLRVFNARFPFIRVINGYGLTEAGPRVTYTPPGAEHKFGSVGLPIRGAQIAIKCADGTHCGPGEIGEILVRTPSLCDGYLIAGRLERLLLTDGLLRTGDMGYRDPDGDLFITGRVDDLILTGSHNVNPGDVEDVVRQVEGVADCIVFGLNDALLGQRIACAYTTERMAQAALIQLEPRIRAACTRALAGFQMPKTFLRWDVIPVGMGGKKSRNLARQLLLRECPA